MILALVIDLTQLLSLILVLEKFVHLLKEFLDTQLSQAPTHVSP